MVSIVLEEDSNRDWVKCTVPGFTAQVPVSSSEELVWVYQMLDHLEDRVKFLVNQIKHKNELNDKLMNKVM